MEIFDNVNKTVKDDLTITIEKDSKLSIAADIRDKTLQCIEQKVR